MLVNRIAVGATQPIELARRFAERHGLDVRRDEGGTNTLSGSYRRHSR
jgi:hypothetical protein